MQSSKMRKGFRELILKDLIKCYKSEPCLWNTKSKAYYDKRKKRAAYDKLLQIYRIIEPQADRDAVVKKINIIRTNRRKEKRKVESGNGNGEIYVPTLWYYHLLDFLDNGKNTRTTFSDLNDEDDRSGDNLIQVYVDEPSVQDNESKNIKPDEISNHSPVYTSAQTITTSTIPDYQSTHIRPHDPLIHSNIENHETKPAKYISPDNSDNDYESLESHFKRPKLKDDRYDVLGKYVTLKMKNINNSMQRLLVEKIINDGLFMAEMGQLTMSHAMSLTQNCYLPQYSAYNVSNSSSSNINGLNITQQSPTLVTGEKVSSISPDCAPDYDNEGCKLIS